MAAARAAAGTTARRAPQDRKPKATRAAGIGADGKFTFTHKQKTYTFAKPISAVRAPAFQRAHRRRDPIDLTYTVIEYLADGDDALLEAIDSMTPEQFHALNMRLGKAMQSADDNPDAVGESEGS